MLKDRLSSLFKYQYSAKILLIFKNDQFSIILFIPLTFNFLLLNYPTIFKASLRILTETPQILRIFID